MKKQNNLQKIVSMIGEKSPLQKKRLNKYFAKREESFFSEAEVLAQNLLKFLESENIPLELALDSYLELFSEIMRCQRNFSLTGEDPMN